jgi:hypothetical protein
VIDTLFKCLACDVWKVCSYWRTWMKNVQVDKSTSSIWSTTKLEDLEFAKEWWCLLTIQGKMKGKFLFFFLILITKSDHMELQPIYVCTENTNKSSLEVWKLEPYPKVTILLFYHFSIENNNVIVKCNT